MAERAKPAMRIDRVETIYSGWNRLLSVTLRMPDGERFERIVEDHGRAVAVLPYDLARRTVLLVRTQRAPVLYSAGVEHILEAAAGMMDEDDPQAAAHREAEEELGVRLAALEQVAAAWTSPGVSTEHVTLFLAPYGAADRVAAGGGIADEHECLEVIEMPAAELWSLLERGALVDMKTITLTLMLRQRRPQMFG